MIGTGARVYWVCPLIEESEEVDLANVEERFRLLSARFPGKVGLLHGRLKGAEREATMAAFADGRLSILVATTVIEVGVDVPAATVMVIEHAERFGLAQLHQLRGRVGRGTGKSTLPAALCAAARRDRQGAARHHARDRGRLPHRRGGSAPARRRRTCWARVRAACPTCGWPISPPMANCCRRHGMMPDW